VAIVRTGKCGGRRGEHDVVAVAVEAGEAPEALRGLEQGYEERDGSNMGWIKVDPLLDSLHGDPRFEALVQKVDRTKTESKQ